MFDLIFSKMHLFKRRWYPTHHRDRLVIIIIRYWRTSCHTLSIYSNHLSNTSKQSKHWLRWNTCYIELSFWLLFEWLMLVNLYVISCNCFECWFFDCRICWGGGQIIKIVVPVFHTKFICYMAMANEIAFFKLCFPIL